MVRNLGQHLRRHGLDGVVRSAVRLMKLRLDVLDLQLVWLVLLLDGRISLELDALLLLNHISLMMMMILVVIILDPMSQTGNRAVLRIDDGSRRNVGPRCE